MRYIKLYNSFFIRYIFLRYFAYGMQFVNSIVLLAVLGDYTYGIYSFGLLLISYIGYFNLGLNQSVNTILAVKKDKTTIKQSVWSTALTINLAISISLILLNLIALTINKDLWSKYEYSQYSYIVILIGLFTNVNLMFVSLYRIYNTYGRINYNQIIAPLITFIAAITLGHNLNAILLFAIIFIANASSFISFFYKSPLSNRLYFRKSIAKIVVGRGVHLMLYSFSIQLITLSATTMVSVFYLPAELGYFSLAVSMANALTMLVGSIWFMVYPKILNRLSTHDKRANVMYLNKIHDYYVFCIDSILVVVLAILVVVCRFFPQYIGSIYTLRILIVGQIIISSTNGFSTLLIARKKEFEMTKIGLLSVLVVATVSFTVYYIGAKFYFIGAGIVAGIALYSFLVIRRALMLLDIRDIKVITQYFMPYRKLLMILLISLSVFIDADYVLYGVLLVIFAISIIPKYKDLKEMAKTLITNNDAFRI